MKHIAHLSSGRKLIFVLLLLFFIVIAVVTVLAVIEPTTKKPNAALPPTITYSIDQPDESKPDKDTYEWIGRADEPKCITLPSINGGGFVQRVGVDQNNEIAVPNNIHTSGWFIETVKPGDDGLSIIDGHVDGRVNGGIFRDLIKLKIGDEFNIELGVGTINNYKVTKIIQVSAKNATSVLFSQDPKIKSQLNLITCGGKYNSQTKQYDDRIIVYSELL